MKNSLALALILAATIGTAAAQGSRTAGANSGGTSTGANGNNSVSSGNSTNTSSSAANSNPTTAAPNYKPAPGTSATRTGSGKGAPKKAASNQVVASGGQGHNTTPEPKGKVQVAPSATTGKGPKK